MVGKIVGTLCIYPNPSATKGKWNWRDWPRRHTRQVGSAQGVQWLADSPHPEATFYAGALSARGAVQVLLATVAHRNGFITDDILIMLVGVAVTSVICAVPVVRWVCPRLSDAVADPPLTAGDGGPAQQPAVGSTLALDRPRQD